MILIFFLTIIDQVCTNRTKNALHTNCIALHGAPNMANNLSSLVVPLSWCACTASVEPFPAAQCNCSRVPVLDWHPIPNSVVATNPTSKRHPTHRGTTDFITPKNFWPCNLPGALSLEPAPSPCRLKFRLWTLRRRQLKIGDCMCFQMRHQWSC